MHQSHVAILVFFVSTVALAEPISGCAPAAGANDERAVKMATLNALSADVRSRYAPETAGSMQLSNESLRTEISSVVSARLQRSTVLRKQYVAEEGKPARICVEVVVKD